MQNDLMFECQEIWVAAELAVNLQQKIQTAEKSNITVRVFIKENSSDFMHNTSV